MATGHILYLLKNYYGCPRAVWYDVVVKYTDFWYPELVSCYIGFFYPKRRACGDNIFKQEITVVDRNFGGFGEIAIRFEVPVNPGAILDHRNGRIN